MILCVQMHCEMHKVYWKLLAKGDKSLTDLYYTLDNLIKKCTMNGLGGKNSATAITLSAEETMWREGVLGNSTPKQLSDTLLYLLGVNLALRGERTQVLMVTWVQSVGRDMDGIQCLVFKEDVRTKTN